MHQRPGTSRIGRPSALVAVLVAAFAAPPAFAQAPPADPPQFKRALSLKIAPTDAPGDGVSVVECHLNGAQKADGSDLRVVETNRGAVPMRILQISPKDDFVRVAFETKADGAYTLWWGGHAIKQAPPLAIKRGVLAEVHKFPGGQVRDEASMKRAFDRAGPPQGALFVPEIFLAHNPLGEEWSAMIRYTGQFKIEKGGPYDLAFTVADSGYLKIDDKIIEQRYNEGLHGRVRNPRQVELKAGWHNIEVTQVNANAGPTGVVVAWRRGGDKGFGPLPASLFAPVAKAVDGPLESPGKTYVADFGVAPESEIFSPPASYLSRYSFAARFPAAWKPTVSWDFGDGQSSTLARPHHYFLTPGVYSVTMKISQGPGGQVFTATRRVAVQDRLYQKFPRPPEDGNRSFASVMAGYSPQAASAEGALRAMSVFKRAGDNDAYVAWGRAWLAAKETTDQRDYRDEVFDLARMLLLRKNHKAAIETFTLAAGHDALPMDLRLGFIRDAVILTCDYLDDPAAALALADDWRRKAAPGNKQQDHTMLAAITYAAIAKGDGKLAQKSAAEAGARRDQPYDKQQLQQGVMARDIETYIRTRDFDTAARLVDQWERDYPEAMIDGFTRLLRVKLLTAEQRPLVAARVAGAHAKSLPQSFYAAELLYRASTQFTAAGEAESARAAMDLLKSKYPESPYAQDKGKVD